MSLNPPCEYQPNCPGCPRFGENELDAESLAQLEELRASFDAPGVEVVPCEGEGHRMRARLSARGRKGAVRLGIFEAGSHQLVHIPHCPIHHPAIAQFLPRLVVLLNEFRVEPYDEKRHQGLLKGVQLAVEPVSLRLQLVFLVRHSLQVPLPDNSPLARLCEYLADDVHSIFLSALPERTNSLLGEKLMRMSGPEMMQDVVLGVRAKHSASAQSWQDSQNPKAALAKTQPSTSAGSQKKNQPSLSVASSAAGELGGTTAKEGSAGGTTPAEVQLFYPADAFGQANLKLHAQVAERIRNLVGDAQSVVEFYAGVGTIALPLVDGQRAVTFNELGGGSLRGLRRGLAERARALGLENAAQPTSNDVNAAQPTSNDVNATQHSQTSAAVQHSEHEFAHLKVKVLEGRAGEFIDSYGASDVVIVDPPRKGLDKQLLQALLELAPTRLIYLSCGLSSLLKEAEQLRLSGKYRLREVSAWGYFPFTKHVETLAVFDAI